MAGHVSSCATGDPERFREVIARGTVTRIIDPGPEGGVKGEEIVAEGTPEDVAKVERSFTAQYLAPLLRGRDGKVAGKREAVAAE